MWKRRLGRGGDRNGQGREQGEDEEKGGGEGEEGGRNSSSNVLNSIGSPDLLRRRVLVACQILLLWP